MVKENVFAPDTGQSPTEGQANCSEEPQAAAAASNSSPTTNNNHSNNYNLVSSLLNLTKSPVSNPVEWILGIVLQLVSFFPFIES